jgi:ubiquinone/menaquinone biosynthesis C-methylase UbiE
MHESNPQQQQMADESMVRNLAAQAEAIWPQEAPLFARYRVPAEARILDLGCGTGEITWRLAALFPGAHLTGVDLEEAHLERARERCREVEARVEFRKGDALALPFATGSFDLVVCRHVLQAIPSAQKVLAEIHRVLAPGGVAHLLAEDYAMIFSSPGEKQAERLWNDGALPFGEAVGTDNRVGRKMFGLLSGLGYESITADYLTIDTLRAPRDTIARIWEAWRDGYVEPLAQHTRLSRPEAEELFAEVIEATRAPQGYAVWHVPIWSGRKVK